MLQYLSFSKKLTVGFAILLMVSTFGAFFIYSIGKESNLKVAQVFEVWLPALTNENEVFRNVSEARRLEFEFAAAKDATLRAKVKEELESKVNNLFIYQKTLRASLIDKDDNELMDQFSNTWDQYITIHESAVALVTSGKNDQAITLLSQQGTVTYVKAAEILDKLGISLYKKGLQANQNVIESAKKLERMNIAIAIIVAIFGVGLAFFVNKTTSKALNRIAVVLVKCANHIEEKLNHLSETSGNLEKASMSSASAIQETAAALDEISAMTNKNSAGAKKTSDLSKLSSDLLRQSETAMKSVVENISEVDQSLKQIIDAANKNNVDLSEIQTLMENIKAKAGVINDIVFQTKLLSFNASIEAARAGEQGKGFSVVAQEIGNLAQMSGSAAGEISTILDTGNSAVSTIVLSTKQRVDLLTRQSSEKIQGGHDATEDAEMRIAEAVRKGIDVSVLIDEIATACRDQAKGIEEVVKSMNEMDRITQENSHSATEVSRAVVETNAVVDEMRTAVLELEKFLKGNKNVSS